MGSTAPIQLSLRVSRVETYRDTTGRTVAPSNRLVEWRTWGVPEHGEEMIGGLRRGGARATKGLGRGGRVFADVLLYGASLVAPLICRVLCVSEYGSVSERSRVTNQRVLTEFLVLRSFSVSSVRMANHETHERLARREATFLLPAARAELPEHLYGATSRPMRNRRKAGRVFLSPRARRRGSMQAFSLK